ncbi:MAG: UvrD-helicase domain-containing protein [Pseudomonadota bacterium]
MSRQPSPSTPHINATVMASAGTGKTYMLINRLVRLLLAGARPEAILAITFTRKAAAEMQSRLGERLFALASAEADELNQRLREMGVEVTPQVAERARSLYETLLRSRFTVRTTTFHAFCQEILLRFPLEADVPPGFELLESSAELVQAARDLLVAEASAAPDGELAGALHRLLDYCGGLDGLQRALGTFLSHRGDWWAYTEAAPQPLEFARQALRQQLGVSERDDPRAALFSTERMQQLAEFTELLMRHPIKSNLQAAEALATARNHELEPGERFSACREAFLTQKDELRVRKASKTQEKKMGPEGEARFLQLHQALGEAVLETLDRLLALEAVQAADAWYLAGVRLLHHYQQLKQERRVLDFTDLEWRAYRLLSHADNALWVQYKLDQRIDHLLVDEFQDTNPTQWRLLLPLLQEMAAGQSEQLRSVFLVGDAKQSIYRFRRAEPRLFQAAHHWLADHLAAETFPLHTSWRSAPTIMQCVNRVFDQHGPQAGVLRDFTRHDTNLGNLWGRVTVLPLILHHEQGEEQSPASALRDPLQQPRPEQGDDAYEREGAQIAAAIETLIHSGTTLGEGEKAHPVGYGDIMILVRKRSHTGYYEEALRQRGIPYLGAERGTLLNSLEVSDMVALLELLFTPYNNLSLATVLRSPLFSCSDSDLTRLAANGRGGWYQRLQALAETAAPGEPLAEAATTLARWHQLAGKIPIHDLLDRIFCEGNVLERYRAAFPPHLAGRAVANLTRFLELALEVDSGRYPSLGHFLARLASLRDDSDEAPDEAPAAGSSERVRILTIHAAKGLEAPVVFLADSAVGDSPDKAYRALVNWPPEAPRPERFLLVGKAQQQPAAVRQLLDEESREQERESANLLYVALTRARQLLYISGVKPRRGEAVGWYGLLRQALDPLDACDAGEACTLETGTPPAPLSRPDAPPPPEQTPDPALSRALRLEPPQLEIAPSRHGGSTRSGAEGDEDGRLRGLVIHRLLEEMTRPHADLQRLHTRIAAEFDLEPEGAVYRRWLSECRQLVRQPELATVFAPERGVESLNEVPIIYQHQERTVHGVIDRLLLYPDAVWVVDYKSHHYADSTNATELGEGYRQQMDDYARGVARLWPQRQVRRFVLFTAPQILYELKD